MPDTAKLFKYGQRQAVRLPKASRFEGSEVEIRRDELTGEVILKAQKPDWRGFFELASQTEVPDDFLSPPERMEGTLRDPFEKMEP